MGQRRSGAISGSVSDFFGVALVEYPFDFRYSPLGIAVSFGIAVLLAVLASIAPARFANRQSVLAVLQNGA